jgi:hypothetical protein
MSTPVTLWVWSRCLRDSAKYLPGHSFEKFKSVCWSYKLFSTLLHSHQIRFSKSYNPVRWIKSSNFFFSFEGSCEYFATTHTKSFFVGLSLNKRLLITLLKLCPLTRHECTWYFPHVRHSTHCVSRRITTELTKRFLEKNVLEAERNIWIWNSLLPSDVS